KRAGPVVAPEAEREGPVVVPGAHAEAVARRVEADERYQDEVEELGGRARTALRLRDPVAVREQRRPGVVADEVQPAVGAEDRQMDLPAELARRGDERRRVELAVE